MVGRRSSSRVVAEKMETRRRVDRLEEDSGGLAQRGHSTRRWEILDKTGFLPSKQSLVEWLSLLEAIQESWSGGGGLIPNIHICTSSQLSFRGVKTFKNVFDAVLFLDEIYSHPGVRLESKKSLSLVTLPPLKACIGVLTHVEENY